MSKRTIELGKAIKQYRLDSETTQESMANYLGISRQTLIRIEAGRGMVSDLVYAKVRRKLDKVTPKEQVA